MMDASLEADGQTAADYDYDVDITRRVVGMAHWIGASVEGELGVLGSLESVGGEQEGRTWVDWTVDNDRLLTDPDQALGFVVHTTVDAPAIARGTNHGAYKFSRQPDGDILAMTAIFRKVAQEDCREFDPRKFRPPLGGDGASPQRGAQHSQRRP